MPKYRKKPVVVEAERFYKSKKYPRIPELAVHLTLSEWCKQNGFSGFVCNGAKGICECQFDIEVDMHEVESFKE